jgi:hypothetical protein
MAGSPAPLDHHNRGHPPSLRLRRTGRPVFGEKKELRCADRRGDVNMTRIAVTFALLAELGILTGSEQISR